MMELTEALPYDGHDRQFLCAKGGLVSKCSKRVIGISPILLR